jgi:hypothetical protein
MAIKRVVALVFVLGATGSIDSDVHGIQVVLEIDSYLTYVCSSMLAQERRAEKEKGPLDRLRASTVAVRVSVTHIPTCHTPNKTVTVHLPTEAGLDDVQTLAERVCAAHCVDPDFAAVCLETLVEELLDDADRLREDRAMKQPPKTMAQEMFDEYTNFGTIPVHQWWDDGTRAQSAVIGSSDPWPVSLIDALMHRVSMRQEGPNYPDVDVLLYEFMDQVSHEALRGNTFFDQASVVVVGTLVPWYEAVALYFGASNTMTIEYNTLHYRHPKMRSSTQDEYWAIDAARRPRFDIGMSISSFEHDGLGRYGPYQPQWRLAVHVRDGGDARTRWSTVHLRPGGRRLSSLESTPHLRATPP